MIINNRKTYKNIINNNKYKKVIYKINNGKNPVE